MAATFIDALCDLDSKVQFELTQDVGHVFITRDAAQDALAWISARFGGRELTRSLRTDVMARSSSEFHHKSVAA